MNEYDKILKESVLKHKEILKQMKHLSRMHKNGFDNIVHQYHNEVFGFIDCKRCGNCCKNLGPVFRKTDIKHICETIGISSREFMDNNLQQDPDGVGFMLNKLPCLFQEKDNTCSIYEERTLSCRNFPRTNSINIQRKLVGLAMDSLFCPAAYLIAEKIINNY